jgi:methyltransferase-like protein
MKVLQINQQENLTEYEGITNKLTTSSKNMKVLQTNK